MRFRRKLLLVFALIVFVSVGGVAWITSALARKSFEKADAQRTAALVAQFRREFDRRGEDIAQRVEGIAKSEPAIRMAVSLSHGSPDYGAFLNEAKTVADDQQLDFLDFVDTEGTIISSAQWPAKFGYKESFPVATAPSEVFLNAAELRDGTALILSAVRQIKVGDTSLYVIGGRKLDKNFVAALDAPTGVRTFFYQNLGIEFSPKFLIVPSGQVKSPERLAPVVQAVRQSGEEASAVIHWSSDAADDEIIDAIPLNGANHQLLGILLIANSRQTYVELLQHIRSAAALAAVGGILLAVLLSGWLAARVTRPMEQLAKAAHDVASGNWNTQVSVRSQDELAELAQSFNRMTHELLESKERLMQTERVAAWRELARRLAHELKNPLFPLQLTVENLMRAREHSPEQFDEMFRESAPTLLTEIANLKTIISRFSEFSRMPQPQFQRVQLNEIVEEVARLYHSQLNTEDRPPIQCKLELSSSLEAIAADPDLLHRAISNLVSNAIDAMPSGGTVIIRTLQSDGHVSLEISDTGAGLTPEDRARLFTPYFTTKHNGTGLGLAIVQSIVSDHGGRITVQSDIGKGTTFHIELPPNADKLAGEAAVRAMSGKS
jgi:two-component system, NtrC family, nitrogen regulation sensor histidine kinase NtrY